MRLQSRWLSQSFRMLDLAPSVPVIFPSHRIWVCKWVEVGEQLEPFTLLLWLLNTTHCTTTSPFVLTKVMSKLMTTSPTEVLTKSKEVAWKETLVGERASSLVLLVAQLKYLESDRGGQNV